MKFTNKISVQVVFLSLLFVSVLFFPQGASAAPCDMISSYGLWDNTVSTPQGQYENSPFTVQRPFSMIESGYYNEHNTGAGVTKLTWDANYLGGWQGMEPAIVTYELPNSYHCSGTPTTTPLSFVLPGGIVQSKNLDNKVTFSTGKHYPISALADQLFYNANLFILPCAEPGTPWDGHLGRGPNTSSLCNQVDEFVAANPSIDTTGVGVSLKSPWGLSVQQEDEAIEQIAKTGKIRVQGAGVTRDIPATNCVRIAGPDPVEYAKTHGGKQPIKVVFMRENSHYSNVSDFKDAVSSVIDSGFRSTYPLSIYQNDFSFYIDLRKQELPMTGINFDHLPNSHIQSSCQVSEKDKQIVLYSSLGSANIGGYTIQFGKVVFINTSSGSGLEYKVVHEIGHAIGGLNDEYIVATTGNVNVNVGDLGNVATTCSLVPSWDYRGLDNKVYGSVTARGCSFLKTKELKNASDYFRPSSKSIMNRYYDVPYSLYGEDPGPDNRFNVVGCGYMIAGIKGESISQGSAQKYWPECLKAAQEGKVVKDGIPPAAPAPTIGPPKTSFLFRESSFANVIDSIRSLFKSSISIPTAFGAGVYSTSPGFTVKVNGSGFSAIDNAVQLRNISTGQIIEILEISNKAGYPLEFIVPTTTPVGEYGMKVGAFNSPWSNELSFSVLASKIPVVVIAANPVTVKSGQSTIVKWGSGGADKCIGTANNTVPSVWSNPGLNGSMTFFPVGNTTLTLTCNGVGGSKTSAVTILSDTTSKPTVTFNVTPATISTGNGTTISWTAYNATSCTGNSTTAVPEWNKILPSSGTLYVKPTQTTIFTLSCSGATGSTNIEKKVTVNNTNNLSASCTYNPSTSVGKHQLVTRTATATGGTGSYTYSWTGVDGLKGNNRSISTYYSSSGSKSASVTVASGGQSVTTQCPVNVSTSFGPTYETYFPSISSINPISGPANTNITLSGVGFKEGVTFVAIKKGTEVTYIRPETISGSANFSSMTFNFDHLSLTSSAKVGDKFSIVVINPFDAIKARAPQYLGIRQLESNAINFTLTSATESIPAPVITSINPTSGITNSPITITGTGFTSQSTVTVQQAEYAEIITPTSVTSTSIQFAFHTGITRRGEYQIKVNNGGVSSNITTFNLTGLLPPPRTPTPITPTPVTTDPVATSQPITVLPWTGPETVSAGSTLNYTLNWSGGPLIPDDGNEWIIFTFFEKDGKVVFSKDFYPTPYMSKWTGRRTVGSSASVSVPVDAPAGTYDVYTGIYRGTPRQELIPGPGVTPANATSRKYKVGTVFVTTPIKTPNNSSNSYSASHSFNAITETKTSSVWNAIKSWFGFE
ncbi:MAG: IPT/TIG domain-containing protein [Patescibacteria group bacterium]|mgnify:CR=1 FL=1